MDPSGRCEECGAIANPRGPVGIVLEKPVDVLDLSEKIKERLRGDGLVTVGKVFEATDQQLDDISYIGGARVKEIRSAVEAAVDEYIAG
jgi:putative NIF3 family GTP cyclohydrolase 1 type 2